MNRMLIVASCSVLFTICVTCRAWTQPPEVTRKSTIIIDPANKQNIKGNITLALAWGERFSPPQQYLRGFIQLKEAMTRWTKLNTEIDRHLTLSSPHILEMPFVYVTTDQSFDLSSTEKANVKKYLENGGFMVLENPIPRTERSPAEASLKQMIRDALGSRVQFSPIPKDHPIYSCFWDFTDGPPLGAEIGSFGEGNIKSMPKPVLYLEGVWIGNRLAVVYSNKGYIVKWTDMANNIPQLKMGVNLIVFALIQPGGMAAKQ
jgi:hypothetical protein